MAALSSSPQQQQQQEPPVHAGLPIHLLPSPYEERHGRGARPTLGLHCIGPAATAGTAAAAPSQPPPPIADVGALLQQHRRRKDAVARTYLEAAESRTDAFLGRMGVAIDAVPDDYIDAPPPDAERWLATVRDNADLLSHCTQEVFNPHSSVRLHLIDPLVADMWAGHLGPLLASLQQELAAPSSSSMPAALRAAYEADVAYLSQMRALERSFLDHDDAAEAASGKARVGVSDVVPVAGLAMGRVHRLLNEHRTVLSHWTPTRLAAFYSRR
jgi:hypothetical protein